MLDFWSLFVPKWCPPQTPQPHVCSGRTCSMKGKPEAFLKELDRLTDTYPLERSALIQLATRPFPPEFAGQVQTADALHGRHGMTYPQLREMISNYTKTLTRKTRTTDSTNASEAAPKDAEEDKNERRHFRRSKLHARPPVPPTSPVPNSFPAQTTSAITPPSTSATYPPRGPFRPPPGPPQITPTSAPNTYGYPRRGKGLNPCYVCGAADHPWIQCSRKALLQTRCSGATLHPAGTLT